MGLIHLAPSDHGYHYSDWTVCHADLAPSLGYSLEDAFEGCFLTGFRVSPIPYAVRSAQKIISLAR